MESVEAATTASHQGSGRLRCTAFEKASESGGLDCVPRNAHVGVFYFFGNSDFRRRWGHTGAGGP